MSFELLLFGAGELSADARNVVLQFIDDSLLLRLLARRGVGAHGHARGGHEVGEDTPISLRGVVDARQAGTPLAEVEAVERGLARLRIDPQLERAELGRIAVVLRERLIDR